MKSIKTTIAGIATVIIAFGTLAHAILPAVDGNELTQVNMELLMSSVAAFGTAIAVAFGFISAKDEDDVQPHQPASPNPPVISRDQAE